MKNTDKNEVYLTGVVSYSTIYDPKDRPFGSGKATIIPGQGEDEIVTFPQLGFKPYDDTNKFNHAFEQGGKVAIVGGYFNHYDRTKEGKTESVYQLCVRMGSVARCSTPTGGFTNLALVSGTVVKQVGPGLILSSSYAIPGKDGGKGTLGNRLVKVKISEEGGAGDWVGQRVLASGKVLCTKNGPYVLAESITPLHTGR